MIAVVLTREIEMCVDAVGETRRSTHFCFCIKLLFFMSVASVYITFNNVFVFIFFFYSFLAIAQ